MNKMNKMDKVKQYRQSGYKVRVTHFRFDEDLGNLVQYSRKTKGIDVDQNGGYTKVELRDPNGVEVSAEAHCSQEDSFNYSIGTNIALGRALKQLNK